MKHWLCVALSVLTGGLLLLLLGLGSSSDARLTVFASSSSSYSSSSSSSSSASGRDPGVDAAGTSKQSASSDVSATTAPPPHGSGFDLDDHRQVPSRGADNLFFIESSCAVGDPGRVRGATMNARQGCAVESAALANPNSTVYFLSTCPPAGGSDGQQVARQAFSYPNVKSLRVELSSYLNDTPLGEWIREGSLEKSAYPVEHSSDILRLATLWKFGGLYLDLDFVVLRPLAGLGRDFAVAESGSLVANSVLGLSARGAGREVAQSCLGELLARFDGRQWGSNGPRLVTRVLSALCGGAPVSQMTADRCRGFRVLGPQAFFPFYYTRWKLLFDEAASDSATELVLRSGTYAVHAWNKFSRAEPVRARSRQPYALLARRFCPRVYSSAGDTF